jgi:hypothetical protein
MRILGSLLLGALLVGCMTVDERAAQQEQKVDEMLAVYGPACAKLGFEGNSDPWRSCVLNLSSKDSYDRYNRGPFTSNCFRHRGFLQCTTF